MTPTLVSKRTVVDRMAWIDSSLRDIKALPLEDRSIFFADRRNLWSAESCLRRSLEALFDIGRHILARGYGVGVSEYKEIALRLKDKEVLTEAEAQTFTVLAGYRNRLVHFYHEVTEEELFGEKFGTEDEHVKWWGMAEERDAGRQARGQGYRAGFRCATLGPGYCSQSQNFFCCEVCPLSKGGQDCHDHPILTK